MGSAGRQLEGGRIPGERIATGILTSDSAESTGAEVKVITVDANLVEGRTYKIVLDTAVAGTTDDRYRLDIEVSDVDNLQARVGIVHHGAAGFGMFHHSEVEYTAPSTETVTFSADLDLSSGTGVHVAASSVRPTYLYVEYVRG